MRIRTLVNTDEGLLLPLNQLTALQRQRVLGQAAVLAAFNDGQALLARQALGQGEVCFAHPAPAHMVGAGRRQR